MCASFRAGRVNELSAGLNAAALYREGQLPGPSADTLQWLHRVRAQVAGLPVTAWEASCRLSPRGVEPYRMGTGLSPSALPMPVMDWLSTLALPEAVAARVRRSAAFINHLYLAVEEAPQGVVLKLYLEFPVPQSGLLMVGLKWLPEQPQVPVRVTRYTRRTGYSRAQLLAQLGGEVHAVEKVITPPALAAWAVGLVNLRLDLDRQMLPWIEVREEGQSRREAEDLNFYGTGLSIGALEPGLTHLWAAWGLAPGPLTAWLAVMRDVPVGHLSVGTREGREAFLTVYHPVG